MRIIIPALLFGIALSCGPAFASDDDTSATDQLGQATDGQQTTGTTFDGCPGVCSGMDVPVDGDTNVPEPPPPTPVDSGDGN
jgi:hypothetical protein